MLENRQITNLTQETFKPIMYIYAYAADIG